MEFEISLNSIRIYAYHGVYEEERRIGNEFIISLSIYLPINKDILDDSLSHTVSYADLFNIIHEENKIPHRLLETLTLSIAEKIKKNYPQITRGKIKIEKSRPPIPDMLGSASVTLFF